MTSSAARSPAPARARPRLRIVEPSARAATAIRPLYVVLAAVALGALIRASFVFAADFPINDGGLFYSMVRDLSRADFRLPETTSYNGGAIPFAYPPLGLYVAAFLDRFTPLSTVDVLRFLPFAVSVATIGAFYLLARELLSNERAQLAALVAFALLPRAFMTMIMGGGLTRAFGFLFAILALQQLHRVYARNDRYAVAGATACAALTLLSHSEMSWFLFCSAAVMFAAYGRNRAAVMDTGAIALGALLLSALWWTAVIARHGAGVFVDAGSSRGPISVLPLVQLLRLNLTDEPLFPLLSVLGLCGVLACLSDRRYVLPAWLIVMMLTASWVLPMMAVVPLALLIGIGVTEAVLPLLDKLSVRLSARWFPAAVIMALVCYAALSALVTAPEAMAALPVEQRDAMAWAQDNTPPASSFVIVTGEEWWRDKTSEWFPALTGRVSIATPQGMEWVAGESFDQRIDDYEAAQACNVETSDCLSSWSQRTGHTFSHVYVSKEVPLQIANLHYDDCCAPLRESLASDPAYTEVYDGPGATIFALRAAPPHAVP